MRQAPPDRLQFALSQRIIHWLMVVMVLAMLFIGISMVASVSAYHALISIHRPLGIAIFLLVIVRFINRQLTAAPGFPPTMSGVERILASNSERAMYLLMFAMPLIGWGMLSAARYPIVMFGPVHLPPILPKSAALYTVLRKSHTILAYLFFLTILGHLSAVLFHTLVVRDGLIKRMVPWTAVPPPIGRPGPAEGIGRHL